MVFSFFSYRRDRWVIENLSAMNTPTPSEVTKTATFLTLVNVVISPESTSSTAKFLATTARSFPTSLVVLLSAVGAKLF